jgi:hypothetical protein
MGGVEGGIIQVYECHKYGPKWLECSTKLSTAL